MTKRIISTMLSVIFVLSAFTVSFAAETTQDTEEETSAPAQDVQTTDADEAVQTVETEPVLAERAYSELAVTAENPTENTVIQENATEANTTQNDTQKQIPQITRITPYLNSAVITWTPIEGAEKYFVFTKKVNGGWKAIGSSTTESFEHKNLKNGVGYTYTVRAADKNGTFISDYNRDGTLLRYCDPPELQSVTGTVGGQRVSWKAVPGALGYMVYVKYPNGWQPVKLTTSTTYVDTNVTSGKLYYYTVRCWDGNKRSAQSYYDRKGINGIYIAAPKISGFTPANGGTTIQWSKVGGAGYYRVFVKNSGKWKTIGTTTGTSFTYTGLANNTSYTYTVRCVDKKGNYVSGYDTAGQSCRYLAPPQITKVSDGQITWKAIPAAASYRVYRKTFGSSWVALGKTASTTYRDTTAAKNTLYTYTVRALDANGKLCTYFTDTATYYYNGALANTTVTIKGDNYRFVNGKLLRQGYVTVGGKMYYYNSKGVLQKNGLVGTSKEGYRYADKNGVINLKYTGLAANSAGIWYVKNGSLDRTARLAITSGGVDYNVLNGKAYKVSTEKDRTLFRALKIVAKVTTDSMSKSQKLRACWDHLRSDYGENNPRNPEYFGTDWPEVYANDLFVDGTGNCFSYAAAFAYLAKAIGYNNCYACNSGGHGWSEIEGLVYDVEWSMHSFNYSYYALSYDTPTDVPYKAALSIGTSYSHVKI